MCFYGGGVKALIRILFPVISSSFMISTDEILIASCPNINFSLPPERCQAGKTVFFATCSRMHPTGEDT